MKKKTIKEDYNNEMFRCNCGSPVEVIDTENIRHQCNRPSQSYGMDSIKVPFHRVQIALEVTGGQVRYNWFAKWR